MNLLSLALIYRGFEPWLLGFTGVMAIAAIVCAVFSILIWSTLAQTAQQLAESSRDARKNSLDMFDLLLKILAALKNGKI
jgi:hypothetical protein